MGKGIENLTLLYKRNHQFFDDFPYYLTLNWLHTQGCFYIFFNFRKSLSPQEQTKIIEHKKYVIIECFVETLSFNPIQWLAH